MPQPWTRRSWCRSTTTPRKLCARVPARSRRSAATSGSAGRAGGWRSSAPGGGRRCGDVPDRCRQGRADGKPRLSGLRRGWLVRSGRHRGALRGSDCVLATGTQRGTKSCGESAGGDTAPNVDIMGRRRRPVLMGASTTAHSQPSRTTARATGRRGAGYAAPSEPLRRAERLQYRPVFKEARMRQCSQSYGASGGIAMSREVR
jgi:hypothetical protein